MLCFTRDHFLEFLDKSQLTFSLARNKSSVDPREMGTAAKESIVQKFKVVLKTRNEASRVD